MTIQGWRGSSKCGADNLIETLGDTVAPLAQTALIGKYFFHKNLPLNERILLFSEGHLPFCGIKFELFFWYAPRITKRIS